MEQIGPYVLSHRIGAGGMAEVWMAHRAALGASKTVAVKLLAPNLLGKLQFRKMFVEEARLSMLLNHSNIVQVFEIGEDRGEPYMAMEWIDGINLAELQAALRECGRTMPIELAMYITGEVLRALDYAHNLVHDDAATVVHRDVSPANILVSLAGEVKLTDFGVARFSTEETSGLHVKGKLRYMAPEQLRGCSKAGTVDIYATGAVLHELIDGSKFRGTHRDDVQLIGSICEPSVPVLREPWRIGEALERLRSCMLAPEPDQRPSAEQALRRLRQCPGYRDASRELEALVRWCRGLEPDDRSHRPGRFCSAELLVSSRTIGEGSSSIRGSSVVRAGRFAPAVAVGLAGLCVGGLGIGVAVRRMDTQIALGLERAPMLDIGVQASEAAEPARPATLPAPVLASFEPRSRPPTIAPTVAAAEPAKLRHEPVSVKFVAGAFKFAYVKVGNKRVLIEPAGALELLPGTHKVHVRASANDEWAYFGKLHIRPKHSYLVKLVEPRSLEVKTVK